MYVLFRTVLSRRLFNGHRPAHLVTPRRQRGSYPCPCRSSSIDSSRIQNVVDRLSFLYLGRAEHSSARGSATSACVHY